MNPDSNEMVKSIDRIDYVDIGIKGNKDTDIDASE